MCVCVCVHTVEFVCCFLYVGIHPSCWTYSEGRREGSSPSVSPPRRARFPQDPETLQGQFIMLICVVGIRIKNISQVSKFFSVFI